MSEIPSICRNTEQIKWLDAKEFKLLAGTKMMNRMMSNRVHFYTDPYGLSLDTVVGYVNRITDLPYHLRGTNNNGCMAYFSDDAAVAKFISLDKALWADYTSPKSTSAPQTVE